MATQKITVLIDADGSTTVESSGFKGKDCLKATLALEKALGAKVSDVPTAEMHEHAVNRVPNSR